MAWIESHQELARHPKAKRLVRLLGCTLPQALGHLHLLWWWAMDYAPDGDLSGYDAADIAEACDWPGDPQVFVDGLLRCGVDGRPGFLERTGDRLLIHDWWQYAGRLVERRRQDAERKRASRRAEHDIRKISAGRRMDGARTQPNPTGPTGPEGRGTGEPTESVPPIRPPAEAPSGGVSAPEPGGIPADATTEERQILHELAEVPRYPLRYRDDLELIRRLAVEFPTVDLLAEVKRWRTWLLDHPPGGRWNPRLRLRNWCEIAGRRSRPRAEPDEDEEPLVDLAREEASF